MLQSKKCEVVHESTNEIHPELSLQDSSIVRVISFVMREAAQIFTLLCEVTAYLTVAWLAACGHRGQWSIFPSKE